MWIAKYVHWDRHLLDKSKSTEYFINESISIGSNEEHELGSIRYRYEWDQWHARSLEQKQWWTNLKLSLNRREIWETKT